MAAIPKPNKTVIKPLSFEANASLLADAQHLRKVTMSALDRCACQPGRHFWHCDYCNLVRHGERPVCPVGLAP
jgi:hypothetical protein